eukprot:CAMPEP_0171884598 /NCGR_PEP_ID=MMETSP0992-20121227/40856_1 /TAXON_ID=483369 /ORGANISM="non described non described, Strain CCMP2098" /LENGTH=39 /DNA_ID= /DNA_START= /DNA_END= /DNA_ORIENTATION=
MGNGRVAGRVAFHRLFLCRQPWQRCDCFRYYVLMGRGDC